MLPEYNGLLLEEDLSPQPQSNQTYRLTVQGRVQGRVDGLEAIKQAIYLQLRTEKNRYAIYSEWYGVELEGCIGEDPELAQAKICDTIVDALIEDDRVLAVEDFSFERKGKNLLVKFNVETEYGEIKMEEEVAAWPYAVIPMKAF